MKMFPSAVNKKAKIFFNFFAVAINLAIALNVNAQTKTNVIFILGDDIGYSIPTVNGGQSYSTPNLDSMARNGMNFSHCEAMPLCSPSRFLLLTGKYNFRNYSNWGYMNDSEKTFGNLMRDAGYATGFFGKLQLAFSYSAMNKWGFDKYSVFELTEDTVASNRYKNPVLVDNNGRVPDSVTLNKYCDDMLTDRVLNFIDSNKNKPFFIYYPMSIGHRPFSPTPDNPEFASSNPDLHQTDTTFFPTMMNYMDQKIGQIIQKVKSLGIENNTLIIYAGDNGTPTEIFYRVNDTTLEGEKGSSKEGGTHVPLFAYWPGHIQPGSYNDDLIDFTDFFPTFADASSTLNLNPYGTLDGKSFYNTLIGGTSHPKTQLFFHYCPNPGIDGLTRWTRDKVYKYYGNGKFFNIVNDVEELHPLSDQNLTQAELSIKASLKHLLDSMPTWKAAPLIKNQFVKNISSNVVTVGGTIINTGASHLIERGSTLVDGIQKPTLDQDRKKDSLINTGIFMQNRDGLTAQSPYVFSMYAMNANPANSTGYAFKNFYTLSSPPVQQPDSLWTKVTGSKIVLNWSKAVFPQQGATKAGYLLVYSVDSVVLSTQPNGYNLKAAVVRGKIVTLTSTNLPRVPVTTAIINNSAHDSIYHFLLVPYTWNGSTTVTYNYLTQGARSIVVDLRNTGNQPIAILSKPLLLNEALLAKQ